MKGTIELSELRRSRVSSSPMPTSPLDPSPQPHHSPLSFSPSSTGLSSLSATGSNTNTPPPPGEAAGPQPPQQQPQQPQPHAPPFPFETHPSSSSMLSQRKSITQVLSGQASSVLSSGRSGSMAPSSSSSSSPPSSTPGSTSNNSGTGPAPILASWNDQKNDRRKSSALRKLTKINPKASAEQMQMKAVQARRNSFMSKVNSEFASWTQANPEGSHEMLRSSYPYPYPSIAARDSMRRGSGPAFDSAEEIKSGEEVRSDSGTDEQPSEEKSHTESLQNRRNKYLSENQKRFAVAYQKSLVSQQTRSSDGSRLPDLQQEELNPASKPNLTLRILLFLMNAAMVIVCIVVIASFSFNAHDSATLTALNNTGLKIVDSIAERLEIVTELAAEYSNNLAAAIHLHQINMTDTEDLASYIYDVKARTTFELFAVFLGDSDGNYLETMRLDSVQLFGMVRDPQDAEPIREVFLAVAECGGLNSTCPVLDLTQPTIPAYTRPFQIHNQSWYQTATAPGFRARWLPPSSETASRQLGHYFVSPVVMEGTTYVAGVIIRFLGFSRILGGVKTSLQQSGGNVTNQTSGLATIDFSATFISFVVEETGNLVATSNTVEWEVQNNTAACGRRPECIRVNSAASPNPTINAVSTYLAGPTASDWASLSFVGGYHLAEATLSGTRYSILVCKVNVVGVDWYVVGVFDVTKFMQLYDTLDSAATPVVAVLLVLFSLAVTFVFTRSLTNTLNRVSRQLFTIASLDFTTLAVNEKEEKSRIREVTRITHAMASMKSGLTSFSKYVPSDVVRLLQLLKREAVLGVDEAFLSILFSDIADFTTISESLQPSELVELLSLYLDEMSKIVIDSGGVVDKYIGDAIMAFWNSPLKVENHQVISCRVALQSQERLRELHLHWKEIGYPLIRMRIGVHAGTVLVGNLGSPDRLNYTCIGDNVNLASRLEGLNKSYGTEILISEASYALARRRYICRPLDYVVVKGKNKPVLVYELVGAKERVRDEAISAVRIYTEGFNAMIQKKFKKAEKRFKEFLELVLDDIPATKHLKTCKEFQKNPPPGDWDGVVIMTEK